MGNHESGADPGVFRNGGGAGGGGDGGSDSLIGYSGLGGSVGCEFDPCQVQQDSFVEIMKKYFLHSLPSAV